MHQRKLSFLLEQEEEQPITKSKCFLRHLRYHFTSSSHRVRHVEEQHAEEKSSHECEKCKTKFLRRDNLQCHIASWAGGEMKTTSHQCELCLRHFPSEFNWTHHMASCTGPAAPAVQESHCCLK